jgi:hypothetical protein
MTKGICQHCGEPLALETSLGYHTHCAIGAMEEYAKKKQAALLRGIISNGETSIDFLTRMVNELEK